MKCILRSTHSLFQCFTHSAIDGLNACRARTHCHRCHRWHHCEAHPTLNVFPVDNRPSKGPAVELSSSSNAKAEHRRQCEPWIICQWNIWLFIWGYGLSRRKNDNTIEIHIILHWNQMKLNLHFVYTFHKHFNQSKRLMQTQICDRIGNLLSEKVVGIVLIINQRKGLLPIAWVMLSKQLIMFLREKQILFKNTQNT